MRRHALAQPLQDAPFGPSDLAQRCLQRAFGAEGGKQLADRLQRSGRFSGIIDAVVQAAIEEARERVRPVSDDELGAYVARTLVLGRRAMRVSDVAAQIAATLGRPVCERQVDASLRGDEGALYERTANGWWRSTPDLEEVVRRR